MEKKEKPGLLYGLEIDGAQRAAYTYDALARQTKKILKLPNEKEYVTSYSYLPGAKEGLTTNLVSEVKNGNNQREYTYDALGNIVTISENGGLLYSYEYDSMNRLVREDDGLEGKTICYTYDVNGNLLSRITYDCQPGYRPPVENALEVVTYEYTNPDWADQLSAYNGEEITYDAMGNPFDYRGMILTWRKGRQLESLQKEDGSVLNFIYDCDGARVQKSEDSANGSTIKETRYYWNGDQLAALQDGEDLIQFTYDEKGIPFSMKIGEDVYYYLYNVQGDVVGLLDSNGVEVVSYRYSSWGKILETFDTSDNQIAARNPFRYRGYILDEETGMYYVSSRYYDPEVGRFISPDTEDILLESPTDLVDKNLYAYCDDNPVMRKDSDGEWWITAGIMAVGGVIGAFVGAATSMVEQVRHTGTVNWKSVAVAAGSGFVSGAVAASPLGRGGQIVLGAVIGGGSYAADCAVNKKRIQLDEMTVSVATGAFAGWLGGDGANKEKTLTNTIKIAKKNIKRMELRKCVSYVAKQNARTKAWRNNILSYSVLDGVIKFSAGTAISTHTASRWGQIRKNIKSILNNSFRW